MASSLCFIGHEQVEFVRFTFLEWTLSHGRLDTYLILRTAAVYEASPAREPADLRRQRRAGAALENGVDNIDLFDGFAEDEEEPAPMPDPGIAEEYDPLDELLQEAEAPEDLEDAAAQVQPEERDNMSLEAGSDQDDDEDVGADPMNLDALSQPPQPPQAASADNEDVQRQEPLPIYDAGFWRFRSRANNSEVGRLMYLGAMALKAECRKHKSCSSIVSMPGQGTERLRGIRGRLGRDPLMADIEGDLVQWLSTAETSSAAEHASASRTMKSERWMMKLRNR